MIEPTITRQLSGSGKEAAAELRKLADAVESGEEVKFRLFAFTNIVYDQEVPIHHQHVGAAVILTTGYISMTELAKKLLEGRTIVRI